MKGTVFVFGDLQESIREQVASRGSAQDVQNFDGACVQASHLLALVRSLQREEQDATHIVHVVADGTLGESRDPTLYVTQSGSSADDVSPRQAMLRQMGGLLKERYGATDPHAGIVLSCQPEEGEKVMGRPTANAFFDTDLTKELREKRVRQIVICGVSTSGIVLSTIQGALDVGLSIYLAEDGCMDFGEMHNAVMTYLSKRVTVFNIAELKDHDALRAVVGG